MHKNVGTVDRVARGVMAVGLLAAAWVAPLELAPRVLVFGIGAVYVAFTAFSGTCLGYRLMGKSTCGVPNR